MEPHCHRGKGFRFRWMDDEISNLLAGLGLHGEDAQDLSTRVNAWESPLAGTTGNRPRIARCLVSSSSHGTIPWLARRYWVDASQL
eukprot:m.930093 g.930093  ORF g.930093 m.930093 type:complete len:86 (+) comp172006_c0_seq1:262-519(+)